MSSIHVHVLAISVHVLWKYRKGQVHTVMILSFRIDRSGKTVQTQIKLLLEEQSDQGLHCFLFQSHLLEEIPYGLASVFEF